MLRTTAILFLFLATFSSEPLAGEYDRLVRQGDDLLTADMPEEALQAWNKARRLDGSDSDLKLRIAIAHSMLEDWEQAEKGFRDILAISPDYPKALFNMGLLFCRRGEFDEAAYWFGRLHAIQPTYPELNFHVGLLFERGGRGEKAKGYYIREVNVNPSCAKAWERLQPRGDQPPKGLSDQACYAIALAATILAALMLWYHRSAGRRRAG